MVRNIGWMGQTQSTGKKRAHQENQKVKEIILGQEVDRQTAYSKI